MTDHQRNTRLLRRAKSAVSAIEFKRQPTVVLYVDQNCPVHGSQGSTRSLHQNGSNNDLVSADIQPFNNNPPLPHTQRDIVGNNLHFNSLSQMNGWNDLTNEQLGSLLIYRDALKQNLTTPDRAESSYPKIRLGRSGGHWRHIQQTNSHAGSNLVYINGTVRVDDSFKSFTPRFGHRSASRPPQQVFTSSSSQDLSTSLTDSVNASTWSLRNELNHRPSLAQYSNVYEQRAKDGFAYWPADSYYKKPRCRPGTTGTYKTWLGLSDSILKL